MTYIPPLAQRDPSHSLIHARWQEDDGALFSERRNIKLHARLSATGSKTICMIRVKPSPQLISA